MNSWSSRSPRSPRSRIASARTWASSTATTDLYKRYVEKFGKQEDSVEKMREQITKLTTDEARLRKALDDYLNNLVVA